jgi:hypothetical protein
MLGCHHVISAWNSESHSKVPCPPCSAGLGTPYLRLGCQVEFKDRAIPNLQGANTCSSLRFCLTNSKNIGGIPRTYLWKTEGELNTWWRSAVRYWRRSPSVCPNPTKHTGGRAWDEQWRLLSERKNALTYIWFLFVFIISLRVRTLLLQVHESFLPSSI